MHDSGIICTDRQNYNAVDLTKFLCSILVVIIHVPPLGGTQRADAINYFLQNYLGRIAVPFFFVMAGFFLFRKTSQAEFDLRPIKKYLLRTLRLYLIWTAVYLPLSLHYVRMEETGIVSVTLHYLRNVLFVGSYVQLWYLNALIVAVAIVSCLLYKKVRIWKILVMAACLYVCGLFGQSWFGLIAPLKERAPLIWFLLRQLKKVIISTRNGVFEGFLFVSMGMCFAFFGVRIRKAAAFAGFVVCMILMYLELTTLESMHCIREYSMFLFLVPATFFLCAFVLQVELPDHPIYRQLRTVSILVYFLHTFVNKTVGALFYAAGIPHPAAFASFALTLLLSVAIALAVIRLSDHPKYAWLKQLYH